MSKWTYGAAQKGYARMWDGIVIKGGADTINAAKFVKKIIAGEKQYRVVEAATGVPWYFVGALHMREASCNFMCVLHNGEQIVGTRKKTKLVPAGRGPFATWADAAIDALNMKAVGQYRGKWCPSLMAWFSEEFNGEGYHNRGVQSPYCWAGSNWEEHGKYIRDHVWDKNFDDPQLGTMTLLKALENARPDIAESLDENHVMPMAGKTKAVIAGTGATVIATASQAVPDSSSTLDQLQPLISIFQNNGTMIGVVFTVAIVIGTVAWHFYEKAHVENTA